MRLVRGGGGQGSVGSGVVGVRGGRRGWGPGGGLVGGLGVVGFGCRDDGVGFQGAI